MLSKIARTAKEGIRQIAVLIAILTVYYFVPFAYPHVYAYLFVTGDEEVIDVYRGDICLYADIPSKKYKWKNITNLDKVPWKFSNSSSTDAEDCFGTKVDDSFIVRLKTDKKTVLYNIRTHKEVEIIIFGMSDLSKGVPSKNRSIIKISDNKPYDIVYDEHYLILSDNLTALQDNAILGSSSSSIITLEGGFRGLNDTEDIVLHNLQNNEDYNCIKNVLPDNLEDRRYLEVVMKSNRTEMSGMKCKDIPLIDGDNHFKISATDKVGRKVHWYLILTKVDLNIKAAPK